MNPEFASNNTFSAPSKLLGRPFGDKRLAAVREEILSAAPLNRAEIARRVCHRLGWTSPGGRYQYMSARVALLRLERDDLIELPPPTRTNGNGRGLRPSRVSLPETRPVECSVEQLEGLNLWVVQGREQSSVYNRLMQHYHYLGYNPMAGAQVRYFFGWKGGLLGAIGFGASAWKLAPRDLFIGWVPRVREHNLHLIVNNSRFLILPWVRCPNLASKILSQCARLIPEDFNRAYGYRPVLLESFIERDRFRGGCYRAANWVYVGQTQGRGKKHVYKTPGVPVKDIWLYPLVRNYRRILCSGEDRCRIGS